MWRHKPDVKDAEKKKTQMEAMWPMLPYLWKSAAWVNYENFEFQNFDVAFLILLSIYLKYYRFKNGTLRTTSSRFY